MSVNMPESVGKMILRIKRNSGSGRRRGEQRTRSMTRIGTRMTRNTRESRKAARRERYANNPEYREREKQRRREFARDNPEYKEKKKVIYAGVSETKESGGGGSLNRRFSRILRIDADFAGFGLSAVFDRKMRDGENEENWRGRKLESLWYKKSRESEVPPTEECIFRSFVIC